MPSDDMPFEYFTDAELTALARLLTIILKIDGHSSPEEERALAHFAERVRRASVADGRKFGGTMLLGDAGSVLAPYLASAAQLPSNKEEFTKAAAAIERPQSRETIYAALFDLASADLIVRAEWDLLKILVDTWQLPEA